MLKRFFVLLAIVLTLALILGWIYLPSITRYRELKTEEERLGQRIREIDAQIKSLADERHLLQTDIAYLEKVIREELGFVKPGEIVYELIAKKNPSNPTLASSGSVVTPEKTTGSVAKPESSEKIKLSPMMVAASLANATPRVPRKKVSKPAA